MTPDPDAQVPVVGGREPCPCGSGRRYKACHGRAARTPLAVRRPFAGLAGECDWVALREVVPAATAPLRLRDGRTGEPLDQPVTDLTAGPRDEHDRFAEQGASFAGA